MWAYATLALKDDPLFRRLLDSSIVRIEDHDTQNLANTLLGTREGAFVGCKVGFSLFGGWRICVFSIVKAEVEVYGLWNGNMKIQV